MGLNKDRRNQARNEAVSWKRGHLKNNVLGKKGNHLCPDGPTALSRACVEVVMKQQADIVHSQALVTLQTVLQTLQASKHNQKMSIVHAKHDDKSERFFDTAVITVTEFIYSQRKMLLSFVNGV